jgi:hypothetical protein
MRRLWVGNDVAAIILMPALGSLHMHRRLAWGFALAGLLLAAIYVVSNWSIYTAQSLVYIQPTPSAVTETTLMHWPYNYDPAAYGSYIQQQMLSMTRPDVLAGAVHKLAPGEWQQSGESDESAADRLQGAVEVERVRTSYLVAITAHANNPDTAAALANALAASYIENNAQVSAPGTAYLAEAAVPGWHFATAGVARNALLLLFAFILLGLAAAVVARKMDQRAVAQNRGIVPEATAAGPVREIPARTETTAVAAEVTASPPALPAAPDVPERAAPERAAVAPQPTPQPTPQPPPVVAETRKPQPSPQPVPAVLASLPYIEPASLWLAGSASQPALKPPIPMMPMPPMGRPKPQTASWTAPPPARQPREEALGWLQEEPPWWLTDAPPPTDSALTQPRKPLLGAWHSLPAQDRQKPAVAQVREEKKAANEMPTRLSGLRSLHFSLGVENLSPKKDARRGSTGSGAAADVSPAHPEAAHAAEALAPQPKPEPAEAKGEETMARKESSRWVTAEPEFLPRPVEQADKGKESRWNRGNYDTGGRDDIQILPSRRGQYKRWN